VAFAILGAGGALGVGEKQYALPPNAFTLAADKKSLATGVDKDKLASAPQFNNNWNQLSDRRFAARVYQHWGKQPYWDVNLTPTGRDESRVYDNQQNTTVAQNSAKDTKDNNGLRVRRNANRNQGSNQTSAQGLTSIEDARRLTGMEVRGAANEDLGELQQIVVDLESGRALYGVVNLKGQGGLKPVTLQNIALSGDDKSLRYKGDVSKLKSAPEFDRNSDIGSADYVNRVYTQFGQERNWFEASGKFNNVHRVTELFNAKVQNSQNENIGQVQNLMIDLGNARALYVIVSAPALVKGDNVLAIPPNAFTQGGNAKTLVTGLDKAKLEAAPRVSRANLRELANATKATEIYQYYGKQPYWNASGLAPTGR
jgi:sporulation protein YlmC with PRC-barrel domain